MVPEMPAQNKISATEFDLILLRPLILGRFYKFDQADDGKAQTGEKAEFTRSK